MTTEVFTGTHHFLAPEIIEGVAAFNATQGIQICDFS